jgi:hypothetical protein
MGIACRLSELSVVGRTAPRRSAEGTHMGLFDVFRKKPKTLLDALNKNPIFRQQKEAFDAMSLTCADGAPPSTVIAKYKDQW